MTSQNTIAYILDFNLKIVLAYDLELDIQREIKSIFHIELSFKYFYII